MRAEDGGGVAEVGSGGDGGGEGVLIGFRSCGTVDIGEEVESVCVGAGASEGG